MPGESAYSTRLLEMRGIRKRFPGVQALADVDFDARGGEVHALVGENGAGKSTLMHILAGVIQPDAGSILFDGIERKGFAGEREAQEAGIAIVFQEHSLFGELTVAENIFAGRQPVRSWGRVDRRALEAASRRCLEQVGLDVDPRVRVRDLPPARQQLVEIAKAVSLDARLLLLDEPTAALTETETRHLFELLARLKGAGAGIIHISHRLEEIFRIADRVTVLKDGRLQGTFPVAEVSPGRLIERMVGREIPAGARARRGAAAPGPALLEVRGLSDRGTGGERPLLRDISFAARRGEILAFAGLAGAGRTETALAMFGLRPQASGEILLDGRPVRFRSPAEAIAAGLGYLPEDRKEAGLFLDRSLADNIAAAQLHLFGSWWLDDRKRDRAAAGFCRDLKIAAPGVFLPVVQLSGGNQQKVLLARWLLARPRALIVDEPTRGVDVGARFEIYALLDALAREGTAVIVISSDLPEVLAVADRILVFREGRIAAELDRSEASEETILRNASMAG